MVTEGTKRRLAVFGTGLGVGRETGAMEYIREWVLQGAAELRIGVRELDEAERTRLLTERSTSPILRPTICCASTITIT